MPDPGPSPVARLPFLGGALTVLAAVAAGVLLLGGGGDDAPVAARARALAPLPRDAAPDRRAAARKAGCVLRDPPLGRADHVRGAISYRSSPPTSGPHAATAALDGVYPRGGGPGAERWIHALEHGRVVVLYRPGTRAAVLVRLEALVSRPLHGTEAYKTLLVQDGTGMPFAVAAVAWGHLLGCRRASEAADDLLRAFRERWVDRGPEAGVPPTG